MKEWLTAQEIAAEALPQLPCTKRGVNDLAERESWGSDAHRSRRRAGRGGGVEYHIGLLPSVAQISYRAKHIRIGQSHMPAAANDATPAPTAALSGRAALERDARLAILRAFATYQKGQRLNLSACEYGFVMRYGAGSLLVDDWVRQCVPALSLRTLQRWRAEAEKGRDRLAVDRGAARKGKGVIETAEGGRLRTFVLALLADNLHLSAQHIRKLCRHEFGDQVKVVRGGVQTAIAMPPVRTFQDALKTLRTTEKVALTKLQNPDLFRSTMAPSGRGSLRHIDQPNSLWQIDASPIDALCTDGRHTIYACVDVATRRIVLSVSRTPRASAVALLIRKAMLAWGVPDVIKTDNGSDFTARDTRRLIASLNVELELSDAYTPQQKGFVERAIGTFQRDCATLLPGFVGHDVADRKAIEARKSFAARLGTDDAQAFGISLSGLELAETVDRWVELAYHHAPHSGLGGRTPFQAAASSTAPIRSVDERALDLLLMPVAGAGTRRTTKFGIRVDHRHYMTPAILPGVDILVRMDPADLGLVYAFAADGGTFLGVGICPELSGIHPETAVRAIKDAQRDIVERGTAGIKAELRRLKKGPAYIERVLEIAGRDAPNVTALPKRETAHTTPQIAAAIEAMTAAPDRHAPVANPDLADAQKRLIAEMAAEEAAAAAKIEERVAARAAAHEAERVAHLPATVRALPETPKARYRRHALVEAAIARGEDVDAADVLAFVRYQRTSEYAGQRANHDLGGDAYLAI